MRKFEIAKGFEDKDIKLPKRSTKGSAGYDFEAADTVLIPAFKLGQKPTMVSTGIKAAFSEDEVLYLFNRSSNPGKNGLVLSNAVGIIDEDYYNNPGNDGHIMFGFWNMKEEDIVVEKGQRIGQGIFQKILFVDDDESTEERLGGFGSTGH